MARSFNQLYINGDTVQGVTATGTTQATAAICPADHVEVTVVTASNRGVILTESAFGHIKSVINADSTETLFIYPWVGAAINGQAANLYLALPPGRGALFMCMSPTKIHWFG